MNINIELFEKFLKRTANNTEFEFDDFVKGVERESGRKISSEERADLIGWLSTRTIDSTLGDQIILYNKESGVYKIIATNHKIEVGLKEKLIYDATNCFKGYDRVDKFNQYLNRCWSYLHNIGEKNLPILNFNNFSENDLINNIELIRTIIHKAHIAHNNSLIITQSPSFNIGGSEYKPMCGNAKISNDKMIVWSTEGIDWWNNFSLDSKNFVGGPRIVNIRNKNSE